MRVLVLGLGALAAVMLAAPQDALAQRGQTKERIEALEEQIRDLQGYVYGEDGATAPVRFEGANPEGRPAMQPAGPTEVSLSPELSLRLTGLEQEVQRLTGRMEELTYAMQLQQQRMDRLVQLVYPDYDEQVTLGLAGQKQVLGDRAYAPAEPVAQPSGGPVDLVTGGAGAASGALPEYATAQAAYAAGRSALFSGRFAEAERAFLALTETYPDSEEYPDGLYYLGETYLAQGDLRASAEAYLDFIRNHGDHPNAARAHLKLGEAFAKADRTKEACRVWLRGVQTYPQMEPELMEQIQEQQITNECPGAPQPE